MGMFERFDAVHYPYPPDDLDEVCGTCGSTGFVSYPVNVGVDESELDPCPQGCQDPDLMDDWDHHYMHWLRIHQVKRDWEKWQWSALANDRLPTLDGDPFFVHTNRWNGPLTDALPGQGERRRNCTITTDEPVYGLAVLEGRGVATCKVPAYLVGVPTDTAPLTVTYEYLGSKVTVMYGPLDAARFRFAHEWDDSYTTADLLS